MYQCETLRLAGPDSIQTWIFFLSLTVFLFSTHHYTENFLKEKKTNFKKLF